VSLKGTNGHWIGVGWMKARTDIMGNKNKIIDPLPDSFASEEEAGEFWDTHSTEDYAEYFIPVDDKIDITYIVLEKN
jgi:hypothetical protein